MLVWTLPTQYSPGQAGYVALVESPALGPPHQGTASTTLLLRLEPVDGGSVAVDCRDRGRSHGLEAKA